MSTIFDITGRIAVVLGGSGALGAAIARAFAEAGAHLVVTGSTEDSTARTVREISGEAREVRGVTLNTLDRNAVRDLAADLGPIDILVNCVGGNRDGATTAPDRAFFDLELSDLRDVMALNLMAGAILPCQEFGRQMVNNPRGGSIINISSMAAARPLTRVVGYGA
ncbi:MAG: SDR family NAD(P)-dependent oxidoreductase, partial [Candidatus Hydrogenedentota bacterium]